MKISICIPQFNRINYLLRSLQIIENQTYPNIEIVISDDCSTDDTEIKILELSKTYKYNTTYVLVNTSYELSYHLNLYRNLYENKDKVPELVYMKYRKSFENLIKSDWGNIIEYHPQITGKINKYFLY